MKRVVIASEATAVIVGYAGFSREADPVGMTFQIHRPQNFPTYSVWSLKSVMEIKDEIVNSGLLEPSRNDVEGGLLLGDEENAESLCDCADYEVSNCLRFTCAGRSFDDQGSPCQGLGDNLCLGRVGGNRESGDQFLEIGHRRTRRGIVKLRIGRINEVTD